MEVLDEVEVDYITLPGWMTSIEDCKTFHELPANAQAYIRKIEEITQIPGEVTAADLILELILCTECSVPEHIEHIALMRVYLKHKMTKWHLTVWDTVNPYH